MDHARLTLARLHNETPVLMALYDTDDRLRYANLAFRAAYFVEANEAPLWPDLMRRNFQAGRGTVIRTVDFEAWLLSTQSRRGKAGFRAFETDLADGRWLWMTETVQPDGWMLCIGSDITALKTSSRAVRQDRDLAVRASQTDELTGIANRRFVMGRFEDMLQALDPHQPDQGCVAIIDIDHFKGINDAYGHRTGDQVLCDFAKCVQAQVRRTDCFGRIGGEEFLLLLPSAGPIEAQAIVERMIAAVRASRPLQNHPGFRYTFSAGIAGCRQGDTSTEVYARADKALYSAKMSGRDRIHLDVVGHSTAAE